MELLAVGYCGRSQGTILKSERSARDYRTTGRSETVNELPIHVRLRHPDDRPILPQALHEDTTEPAREATHEYR